jgi:D-xylose transport system substrate-binding protein
MSDRAERRLPALKLLVAGALMLVLALGVAACGSDDDNGDSGSSGGGGKKIALLLPETKTARYESQDRPLFEQKVKQDCPDCEVLYSNADQDTSKQQQQVEAAVTEGADVIVLDPVDSASAAGMVNRANQEGIPVISYDRLILDAPVDYYISFDNVKVGQLQGTTLADKLKEEGSPNGPIVQINGSPTDNNATLFKQGASGVFEDRGVKVAKEYDTPDWSPDKAQTEMEQAITALGKNGFAAVYAANDGTAGGAIAALKGAGIDPATKWVTGQDAELSAIQRIIDGEQFMTVYKAIKPEAQAAADLALAVANGDDPPAGLINGKTDNGNGDVPSVLLQPVAVTKDKVKGTVVKDGFWSVDEICTPEYQKACQEAGLTG